MKVKCERFIYDYNGEEIACLGEKGKINRNKAEKSIIDKITEVKGDCDTNKLKFIKSYTFTSNI